MPPRECQGPGHQDHTDEKGDQPAGFEQDETRGHADAVAEDDDAEDDPGHRLRGGDAWQGGGQRRDVEGALHEPQPGQGASYQRVSGPSGQQRGGVTCVDDLDRAPGEGIGDPEYQARVCSGQPCCRYRGAVPA